MPLSPAQLAALNRLLTYYDGDAPYDPVNNPGGFRRGGNVPNFEPALKDAATVVQGAGALVQDGQAALASTETARSQAQAAVATGRVAYDTLAQLNANLAPAAGAQGEVRFDPTPANNGTYDKVGTSGSGSWVKKSSATVPALDALTAFVRQVFIDSNDGSLNFADSNGLIGLRVDGAKGLQTGLAQIVSLIAWKLSTGEIGITGTLDLAGTKLTAPADSPYVFALHDANGWILLALLKNGTLVVPALQTSALLQGGDYSADYIAERSNRAVALSAGYRGINDTVSAAAVWAYNQVFCYGQSLCAAQEAWPAKTLTGRSDVLMLGQSTRPGGPNVETAPTPLGDSVFRPAVATVQDRGTGALIDAAGQAALAPGSDALGEDPGVGAMLFARRVFLQRLGVQAADDRRFVITNVGVSGRSIEELSKGASVEYFNRLRTLATATKNAATAAGGSYGVAALFWLQGEWNYSGTNGSTDKATYKTNLKKLYDDFVADICVGIAGQTEKPAIITYQTGATYTVDATDLSIGMAQWEMSDGNPITGGLPGWYLAAPAYPVTDKNGHLDPNGSRWLGLQMGKVFFETVIMRRRWKPLSPTRATVRGSTVLVDFHLPSGTALQFKPVYVGSSPVLYQDRGFTVIDDNGTVPLSSVILAGEAGVKIGLRRPPVGTVNVYYALRETFNGGGNLCDSDPTVSPFNYEYSAGSGDYAAANLTDETMPLRNGRPYPLWNWCIAFKMTAVAN